MFPQPRYSSKVGVALRRLLAGGIYNSMTEFAIDQTYSVLKCVCVCIMYRYVRSSVYVC